jgi:quercetin dioxygenase-like cupin family protein
MMSRNPTFWSNNEGIWVQWFSHPLRYLATAAETGGSYCVSVGVINKDQGAAPHSHDFDEGFYILEGAVEFTAGNQKVLLRKGDYIHVSTGTVHFPRGVSDTPSMMLVIAAPCGFDEFQIKAGGILEGPSTTQKRSEQEIHQHVAELAPKYGINMNPSAEESGAIPKIHVTRCTEGKTFDVVGDRYRFLAEVEHTGGTYAIWHATIAPGGGPPPHIHRREEEGFFVLSGEVTFEVDGRELIGTNGAFAQLPSGSRHRFFNPSELPAEMIIMIAPGGLEKLFQQVGVEIHNLDLPISAPAADEIPRLLQLASSFGIEIG